VAFVGRTGSGKSTIVNLVPRLIEAPADTVFIDGISVQNYPLSQLRSSIGYVPQETFLFSDTLKGNIAFGVEKSEPAKSNGRGDRRLTKILRTFRMGLRRWWVNEALRCRRTKTTDSNRSRVLREPKILILDDSLSSVDTYTEEKILAQLRGVMRDRTSIIVSHRISTVRDADLICVLDEGRIIEQELTMNCSPSTVSMLIYTNDNYSKKSLQQPEHGLHFKLGVNSKPD